MSQNIIGHCPICNEELVATKLTCRHCGLELSNEFSLNKFSYLKPEELEFIECFIKQSGNMKEVQRHLHLSYPAARRKLGEVQYALGFDTALPEKKKPEPIVRELPVYQDESTVVRTIKKKLNKAGGLASITLPKGETFQIYYDEFETGLYATNLPHSRILTWKAFDSAIELLVKKDGTASKGNAMKGKLGSNELPLDSLEGYVAFHAYGVKKGESCLRTISSLAAILEWTGLCENGYGVVVLKS